MANLSGSTSRITVEAEIRRVVMQAAQNSGCDHARRLSAAYHDTGMSGAELVNAIIAEAAVAGVAVEMYQPGAQVDRMNALQASTASVYGPLVYTPERSRFRRGSSRPQVDLI